MVSCPVMSSSPTPRPGTLGHLGDRVESQGRGFPLPDAGGDNARLRPREETQGITLSPSARKSSPRSRSRSRETTQQRRHSAGVEFLPWASHPQAEVHWLRATGRTESAVGISHLASAPS